MLSWGWCVDNQSLHVVHSRCLIISNPQSGGIVQSKHTSRLPQALLHQSASTGQRPSHSSQYYPRSAFSHICTLPLMHTYNQSLHVVHSRCLIISNPQSGGIVQSKHTSRLPQALLHQSASTGQRPSHSSQYYPRSAFSHICTLPLVHTYNQSLHVVHSRCLIISNPQSGGIVQSKHTSRLPQALLHQSASTGQRPSHSSQYYPRSAFSHICTLPLMHTYISRSACQIIQVSLFPLTCIGLPHISDK